MPTRLTHRARPAVGALAGLLAAALVLLVVVTVVQTRDVVGEIRRGQEISLRTQQEVLSCTDPDGDCYRRNAESQAVAVASITEVSIIAAACADRDAPQTLEQIERCVRITLRDRARPEETP